MICLAGIGNILTTYLGIHSHSTELSTGTIIEVLSVVAFLLS